VRATNQDSVFAGDRILVIADGMGGHAAGDTASRLVVAAFAPLDTHDPDQDLLGALRIATIDGNAAIAETVTEHPELDGMGTTVTALYFDGSRLAIAHVGDSRAYLYRSGVLHQLTHDDTFVQSLVDDGRITEDEAVHHPQRNLLLRALNGTELEPSLTQRIARAGDRYLICSDGLSGVVSAEAIADALTEPDPERAADLLVELALVGGGPDNVTVVVADVLDTGAPPTERIAPVVIDPDATGPIGQMTREMPRVPLPPIPEEPASRPRYAGEDEFDDLDDTDGLEDDDLGDDEFDDAAPGDASSVDGVGGAGGDGTEDTESNGSHGAVEATANDRDGGGRGATAAASGRAAAAAATARRRWRRRGALALALVVLVLVGVAGSVLWVRSQFYVGARNEVVGVYRGVNGSLLGVQFSSFQEDSCSGTPGCVPIRLSDLEPAARIQVLAGIQASSLSDARAVMLRLSGRLLPPCGTSQGPASPTAAANPTEAGQSTPSTAMTSATPAPTSGYTNANGAQATHPDLGASRTRPTIVTVTVAGTTPASRPRHTAASPPTTTTTTVTVTPPRITLTQQVLVTPPPAGLFDGVVARALAGAAAPTTAHRPTVLTTTVGAAPLREPPAVAAPNTGPTTRIATRTTASRTSTRSTRARATTTTSPKAPSRSSATATETVTAQTPTVTTTQTVVSTPVTTGTPLAPAAQVPGVTCRVVG
jgi:protein phosphatase